MDPTEARLLQMIHERPADNEPRLVYADWLTLRGDERGELIATQCVSAGLAADGPRRRELHERERQLIERHAREWLGPFAAGKLPCPFDRGFLAYPLIVASEQLAEHRELLLRLTPTLYETVRVVSKEWTRVRLEARIHAPQGAVGRCALMRESFDQVERHDTLDLTAVLRQSPLFQRIPVHLEHPNVVRSLGLACGWTGDRSLACEWLDGANVRTLRLRSNRRLRLDPALAAGVVSQVCRGLEYLHGATDAGGRSLGFVHGRVRPEHVFLTQDGQVKLTDPGDTAFDDPADVYAAMLPGPDQVGRRADILAAALLVCDLIAGGLEPYRGAVFDTVTEESLRDHPPLLRAVHESPRYSSVGQLRAALDEALRQLPEPPARAAVAQLFQRRGPER